MDKDFNAIIIDFGFSKSYKDEKGNINPQIGSGGSKLFAAPELYKGKELTDEKADIFSLGVILFALVTKKFGFLCSRNNDPFYKLIRTNKYELYWDNMKKFKKIDGLSEDFKKLYFQMVSHDPDKRPSFPFSLPFPKPERHPPALRFSPGDPSGAGTGQTGQEAPRTGSRWGTYSG